MNERIGFVGLGLMGQGMATNIVQKGWPLTIRGHRNRTPVEDLTALGATEAPDLASLARASDIVFLCLTGSPEVAEVVAALTPGLAPGAVVVDCSTADPTVTDADVPDRTIHNAIRTPNEKRYPNPVAGQRSLASA